MEDNKFNIRDILLMGAGAVIIYLLLNQKNCDDK